MTEPNGQNGQKHLQAQMLDEAEANRLRLATKMPYPGRLIVVGMDVTGLNLVLQYAVEGRSKGSQNRFAVLENGCIYIRPFDESIVAGDPKLIYYKAFDVVNTDDGRIFVVSNGKQTDTVSGLFKEGYSLMLNEALLSEEYEPDEPNFTPRITAALAVTAGEYRAAISILKKLPYNISCMRNEFDIEKLWPGAGYCIHTYSGENVDPLPSFVGEPYLLPIAGNIESASNVLWQSLNEEYRVCVVTQYIPLNGSGESTFHIINALNK